MSAADGKIDLGKNKATKKKVVKKVVKKKKTDEPKVDPPKKDVKAEEKAVEAAPPAEPLTNGDAAPEEAPVAPKVPCSIVEKPENVSTSEGASSVKPIDISNLQTPTLPYKLLMGSVVGEEFTLRAKVAGGDILHPVKVTWIKGKWNTLTKGDRFEMWEDERTAEHFLKFKYPKQADSGSYKLKASGQIGEDECTFEIKIGPSLDQAKKIEIRKGHVPTEEEAQKDMEFRSRLKRVDQSQKNAKIDENDFWSILKSAPTREYDSIGFKFGVTDMRGMLRRLSQTKKNESNKQKSFASKLPETMSGKIGDKLVFEAEVANELMTVSWTKNGKPIEPEAGYQIISQGKKRTLIVDKATLQDDALFSCVSGKDFTGCEVFVQDETTTIAKGFEDVQGVAGGDAEFVAELSNEKGRFRILNNGIEVTEGEKYTIKREAKVVTFSVNKLTSDDEGFYELRTNGSQSCAEIVVQEKASITQGFSDIKVNFKDTAEFACEVSDETLKGKWQKDGKAIGINARIKVIEDKKVRKLQITKVQDSDQGEYSFHCEGNSDHSISAALELTGANVTCEKRREAPKIYLDHSLTDRSIVVKAGNKVKLDLPISGDPLPVPEWKKGPKDGNQELITATGKRVWSNTSPEKGNTMVVITEAKMEDSDRYICDMVWEKDSDSEYIKRQETEFIVRVIDFPLAPSKPLITDVTSETCWVEWNEPTGTGGCPLTGYIIERKKSKSERWIKLNIEPHNSLEYKASRMIEGTEYQIRVRAVNEVGIGEPSEPSLPFTPLAPCSEPTNFKVTSTTDDSIELAWMTPLEIGAAGIDGYQLELQMKVEGSDEWSSARDGLVDPKCNRILLDKLTTGKRYAFRICAVNKAGNSPFVEIPPTVCAFIVEDAKINLPRSLLKKIKVKVGEKLHVNVPYQGKPKPQISWTKDGKELESNVAVRNSMESSVLFIRNTERWDSGIYHIQVQVGDDIVTADVDVAVIDIPSKPRQVKLVETIGNSASLKWEEPSDSGNTDIVGYVVEKRDARSDDWFVVYDKLRHKQCQVSDLVLGNKYFFRVKAFNEVGCGDSTPTKDFATILKEKTVYKKPEYAPMDFRIKPEFTQNLNNCRIVENYNGTLSCSLKCNPRPTIRWFKNKIEIIDNPKYKLTQAMGIVQLEIRRARASDAGTYMCLASNEMGEASCSAEVTVKELKDKDVKEGKDKAA